MRLTWFWFSFGLKIIKKADGFSSAFKFLGGFEVMDSSSPPFQGGEFNSNSKSN